MFLLPVFLPADAEKIWFNLAKVGKLLGIEALQKLPQLIADNASLLSSHSVLAREEVIQELLAKEKEHIAPFDNPGTKELLDGFKGGIYPVRLNDTYCVDLTIRCKSDLLALSSLSQINHRRCLFPRYIRSSLGQTLLFFSQVADSTQGTESIARAILAQLIPNRAPPSASPRDRINADSFSLVGKGILLGGTIYEFTENLSNPVRNNHILVWLATSSSQTVSKEAKDNHYWSLVNLLCSQKKIQFAYYKARQQYYNERRVYGQIEPIVQEFSQWNSLKNQWLQTELKDLIKKTRNRKRKKALEGLLNESSSELSDLETKGLMQRVTAYLQKFNDRRLENILKKLSQQQLAISQKQDELKVLIEETFSNNQKKELKGSSNESSTQLNDLEANRSGERVTTNSQQHDNRRLEDTLKQLSQQQLQISQRQDELKVLIDEIRSLKQKKELKGSSNESSTQLNDLEANELMQRVTAYLQKFNDRRLEDILKHLSQRQLEILEKRLVQIPTISVNYDRCLRDIKTQLTTIQINRINYQTALKQLQNLQPHTDNLGFLGKFITEDCDLFERQIQYDLDYLASGKELLKPTIDSIRSLVDIQAQKRQLANDLAEKERDRSVEVWVTVVASGLAVSSLSSNAMPKPVELLLAHSEVKDYQKTCS